MPNARTDEAMVKRNLKRTLSLFLSLCSLCVFAQTKTLYQNDFEKAEIGKAPDDFLILEGGFAVKEEAGNKFFELPGAPLDSFAALFGPNESSNIVVSAAISGSSKGRRFPTFGVGLNGVAGYKLQISPAKNLIEIYKDQQSKSSIPFEWKSGEWTMLRLQLRALKPGGWKIEGKVWLKGKSEPPNWMVAFEEKEEPPSGRPSVFGSPFSGTPIKFDDLVVQTANPD